MPEPRTMFAAGDSVHVKYIDADFGTCHVTLYSTSARRLVEWLEREQETRDLTPAQNEMLVELREALEAAGGGVVKPRPDLGPGVAKSVVVLLLGGALVAGCASPTAPPVEVPPPVHSEPGLVVAPPTIEWDVVCYPDPRPRDKGDDVVIVCPAG